MKKFRKRSADILLNIHNGVVLVLAVNINKESDTFCHHTSHETWWLTCDQFTYCDFICVYGFRRISFFVNIWQHVLS